MMGMGESYLSAFAEFLQATGFQLGLVTSLPQFIAAIVQLISGKLVRLTNSRKWFVFSGVLAQACVWPVILVVVSATRSVPLLIILVCLYFLFGAVGIPPWSSWMGDLVPDKSRGKYFGNRNRIVGIVVTLSMILGGFILSRFSGDNTIRGFQILFITAFVARLFSATFLILKFEPKVELRQVQYPGFFQFVRSLNETNFGIFTKYITYMHFGVFIAIPAFIVYWLRYWEFSYLQYMILIATASVTSFLTMKFWGKVTDTHGNRSVLKYCSYVVVSFPFIWYLIEWLPEPLKYPAAIALQTVGGAAWAGFNLSAWNFIYDTVDRDLRIPYFAYHNTLRGIAIFIGGLIGGWLTGSEIHFGKILPAGFFLALLISGTIRLIVVRKFMNAIEEVRVIPAENRSLRIAQVIPFLGFHQDMIVGLNRTLTKVRKQLKKIKKPKK